MTQHDTLIALLLNSLKVFNYKAPPYGSTIIFELHQHNRTDHMIRILYLNETELESPHSLLLPGCDYQETCHLGQFLHSIEDLIPENWRRECGLSIVDENDPNDKGINFLDL